MKKLRLVLIWMLKGSYAKDDVNGIVRYRLSRCWQGTASAYFDPVRRPCTELAVLWFAMWRVHFCIETGPCTSQYLGVGVVEGLNANVPTAESLKPVASSLSCHYFLCFLNLVCSFVNCVHRSSFTSKCLTVWLLLTIAFAQSVSTTSNNWTVLRSSDWVRATMQATFNP
jgi:hypothetical protein